MHSVRLLTISRIAMSYAFEAYRQDDTFHCIIRISGCFRTVRAGSFSSSPVRYMYISNREIHDFSIYRLVFVLNVCSIDMKNV